MDKGAPGSHRDRLRDQCVAFMKLLSQKDRISISEIADDLKMSRVTVRRWLNSFSRAMDLRIEKGIVIIERNRPRS
jgi:DeoR/GlpR family transcriptional regulator of sugar metabolism